MAAEGYDVLRLIEHNTSCYVSSEYIDGQPLILWMKYHPNLSKEQLLSWMRELTKQIGQFHKCRGTPCFRYVNPYSVIVSQTGELYLLDIGAKSNEGSVRKMHRRSIRENFLPEGDSYYGKASVALDIYGLGKTFQYMLSVMDPYPALTKREERQFHKLISRCLNRQSKKAYQTIQDIQKHFPVYKQKKLKQKTGEHKKKKGRIVVLAFLVLVIAAAAAVKEKPKNNANQKNAVKEKEGKDVKLRFEMGMLYLLDLEDYEKSGEYFRSIDKVCESAGDYAVIGEYLNGRETGTQNQLRETLVHAEKNLVEGEAENCYRALIKGYRILDMKEAAKQMVKLGRAYAELREKEGRGEEEIDAELMESLASAYEALSEKEEAAKLYEKLLGRAEKEEKEALYKKLASMWETEGRSDLAGEYCRRGIDELPESMELRILAMQIQCGDSSVSREICGQTVQKYLTEIPEIQQQEAFQKLQQEYDIQVEGEQVWVGK